MMARPRLPSNVLDARGAFDKNPQRRRQNEPAAKAGLGDAPEYFNDEERKVWFEVQEDCASGVFQTSDRHAVEYYCKLMAEMRTNPKFSTERGKTLVQLQARFGMTPSDRSRVAVPKGQKKNPFEELLGKK